MIAGGQGGAGGLNRNGHAAKAGASGAGVLAGVGGAATLTNAGTIIGALDSVVLTMASDVLIAQAGADFIGAVVGAGGTFEVAGGSGEITGLGGAGQAAGSVSASFAGFGSYVIGAGGDWSLTGANALGGGQSLTIDGMLTLADPFTDAAGALITVGAAGAARFLDVAETLAGSIVNQGLLSVQGGAVKVTGSVSAFGTVRVDGGAFAVETAFSQAVVFAGRSGVLELGKSQSDFSAITGFATGGQDELVLDDIGFVNANEASFNGTASGGTLTVSDGTHTARLRLDGDYLGDTFTAASNNHGGVVITAAAAQAANTDGFVAALAALGSGPAAGTVFAVDRRAQTPWSLTHPATQ